MERDRRRPRGPLAVLAFATVVATVRNASGQPQAEDPPKAHERAPRLPHHFAVGVSLLKELGFGAVVRARGAHLGGDLAAGGFPWFTTTLGANSSSCSSFKAGLSPQATGSLLLFFSNPEKRFQAGMRAGGMYNSDLGPGGIVGFQGEFGLGPRAVLAFGAGLQLFPEANDFIEPKLRQGLASGCVVEDDSVREFFNVAQYYLGVNFLWYLF